MGKLAIQLLFLITFFLVLVSRILPATSQEVEDEADFNYDPNGEKGPANWGRIHPEWGACSNGSMQSPIDLLSERVDVVSHLGRLSRSYKPANATLRNRGHDMMLKWEGAAGSIEINGTEYLLKQCHWHSPSEHTINGKRLALEVHMVHESLDGKVAVVGIMYMIGRPDSFLSSLTKQLQSVAGTYERDTVAGVVDPRNIKIGSRKYYRYIGSLTIPPCTENVLWTIVRKVRTATREQVRMLRVAVHDESDTNARQIQPINSRTVKLLDQKTRMTKQITSSFIFPGISDYSYIYRNKGEFGWITNSVICSRLPDFTCSSRLFFILISSFIYCLLLYV